MDRKLLMGVAAVAGIGLLLYLRKSGDQATLAGSSSLVSALGGGTAWASQPISVSVNTKPLAVADPAAIGAAPMPVADTSGAVWGAAAPASSGGYLDVKTGVYHYADGSTYQNPHNYGTSANPQWALTGQQAAVFG